jgi:hypothetical protein
MEAAEMQSREILSTLQTLTEQLRPSPSLESSVSPEVTLESQEAPEPPAPKRKAHHRLI